MTSQPTEVIGIDISKLTLDCHLHKANQHLQVTNDKAGFHQLLKWIKAVTGLRSLRATLVVMEATGLYSYRLEQFLHAKALPFCKRAPLEITRSSGLKRTKTDKADARAIARYGWQKWEELEADRPLGDYHITLRNLLAYRELLVTQRAAQQVFLSETAAQVGKDFSSFINESIEADAAALSLRIKAAEAEIKALIASVAALKENFTLISSVKGVGFVSAAYLLLYTANFTRFETGRQFCTWCGVAPHPHQSGTSIKGQTRVSPLANRKMKSLLHQGAIVAVQHDAELGNYFRRKTAEGKNKMSVYNAVRAKIVARVFSVVRRKETFTDNYAYAA